MRKPHLMIAAVVLALVPLVWAGTIAPSVRPIHGHDRDGRDIVIAHKSILVPVAEAHVDPLIARVRSTTRHVELIVELHSTDDPSHRTHAECWAKNDGGSHDHSHRITACLVRNQSGSNNFRGSCETVGGYGPCGYSMANQHWHSPTFSTGGLVGPWQAVGGFDVVGHSHATHETGFYLPPYP